MKFFIAFIGVNDYQSAKSTLMDFKEKMKGQGEITVFDCEQTNYDFLYNSLTEKANLEKKKRGKE